MRAEIYAVAKNIELELATGGPATRKEITHGSNENERHHYRCRGHTNDDIAAHCSAVEIAELIQLTNRIDRSLATPAITLLKVAA